MTEADEEAWCSAQRAAAVDYLATQLQEHGAVGDWPAWMVAPHVAIWAVESVKSPGRVGWWVITGDLPTDYCSSAGCDHPRLAVKQIAESWRAAVHALAPGDATIADTGLSADLAPLLAKRADLLASWVDDDALWPSQDPPINRPPERSGFLAGRISVPDDFDTLMRDEIERMFDGEEE